MKIFNVPFVFAWELCDEVNAQFDIGLTPDDFYENLSFPLVSAVGKPTCAVVDIFRGGLGAEGCIRAVLEDLIPNAEGYGYIYVVLPLRRKKKIKYCGIVDVEDFPSR